MRVLFWLYLVIFAALAFAEAQDSVTSGSSVTLVVVDVIASVLAIIGMILYWWRLELPWSRTVWKFAVAFLIGGFLVANGVDYPKMMADPDRAIAVVSGLLLVAFVAPSFWMNARYALGHSRRRPPATNGHVVLENTPLVARVSSPLTISVFALVLAFPCALTLAVKNWWTLQQRDRIWPHIIGAVMLSLLLVPLLFINPKVGRYGGLGVNVAAFFYLRERLRSDLDEFRRLKPSAEVRFRPWYTAVGWAMCGLILFILLALLIGLLIDRLGWSAP